MKRGVNGTIRLAVAALAMWGAVGVGCGSDEKEKDGATAAKASLSPEAQEAATVSLRYLEAVVAEDWEAACETRSQRERKDLARLGGSCERALAAAFEGKSVKLFADARVGEVRIKSEKAGVDIVQPGQAEPVLTLVAVRDRGRWRLEDVPDDQAP